jgi:transposase
MGERSSGTERRRGQQERTGPLFSAISSEGRIPNRSPLRQARRLADHALDRLNPNVCRLYPEGGRPSIPPEQPLLDLSLQAIYGIRLERMPIEQLDDNLLFRWFVGLNPDDVGCSRRHSPISVSGCSMRSPWPGSWRC